MQDFSLSSIEFALYDEGTNFEESSTLTVFNGDLLRDARKPLGKLASLLRVCVAVLGRVLPRSRIAALQPLLKAQGVEYKAGRPRRH